jgi:ABC-type transport system involved in multi-copper enzyme maturation permease subunit
MNKRIVKKNNLFNPFLRTYLLEYRLRWKKLLLFSIIFIVFTVSITFFYPFRFREDIFLRNEIDFFRFLMVFASCFFFSDIVCSEFSSKTGYIIFPKINKYKLFAGKYAANLSIIINLVSIHYLTLNISGMVMYGAVIPELLISFGLAIVYAITISAFILFFSTVIPKEVLTTIIVIVIFLIGFYILEQITTVISQDIEPIFSLNYIGNLLNYVIPGGLSQGQRWAWVYYAGDRLPPIKIWLTPTIEMGLLVMSIYIALSFLFMFLILRRKEF